MARGGFRGGYGGMNQANVMKQAQKMQQDFLRMQKELKNGNWHSPTLSRTEHCFTACSRSRRASSAVWEIWQHGQTTPRTRSPQ